ncbi:UvrB/uvrC motif protein [Phycisphaerae bacterium RAS1]|nr:UvrB/uvrC motif protein [Phycisphaerae bacterium RAS1]
MTLDLNELLDDWAATPGEVSARTIIGRDGIELIQLRVDLGVMQMFPDGRPDGARYRGFDAALTFIEHEVRLMGPAPGPPDWQELERELFQTNYRRLALTAVAEDSLKRQDPGGARSALVRAVRDCDTCLRALELLDEHRGGGPWTLRPTLVFNRGRLTVQLLVLEDHVEDAVDEAENGAAAMERLLGELGADEDERRRDPGVTFLRDLARNLRRDYGIGKTLHEQLEEAIENEDFESAARLRDKLRQRDGESEDE